MNIFVICFIGGHFLIFTDFTLRCVILVCLAFLLAFLLASVPLGFCISGGFLAFVSPCPFNHWVKRWPAEVPGCPSTSQPLRRSIGWAGRVLSERPRKKKPRGPGPRAPPAGERPPNGQAAMDLAERALKKEKGKKTVTFWGFLEFLDGGLMFFDGFFVLFSCELGMPQSGSVWIGACFKVDVRWYQMMFRNVTTAAMLEHRCPVKDLNLKVSKSICILNM